MPDISTKPTLATLVGDEWIYLIATPGSTPADRKTTPASIATYVASSAAIAEAARDAAGSALTAGSGVIVTVSDGSDTITLAVDPEFIRDTVGSTLAAGNGITVTVDDAGDAITVAADPEFIRDTVGSTLAAGSGITVTVNDAGDSITLAADPEFIRDTVGSTLAAGSGITVTVNDPGNTVTIAADPEFIRDTIGATLVAGTNMTITVNDAGDQITFDAAGGGGGGPETNAWNLPTALANPASPITPPAITGSTIIRINGITGAKTVNMPPASGVVGRAWALFDVTATGGPFNVTFAGASHDGIGTDPGLVLPVPANGRGNFVAYTDDAGTTWKYSGNYDFSANRAAILAALGITTRKATFRIDSPTANAVRLEKRNLNFGTIKSVIVRSSAGTATANFQIANHTSAGDITPTGAASITGLSAVAISTTDSIVAATAANVMQRSGTAARVLQVVLSSVVGMGATDFIEIDVEYDL